MWSMDIAPHDRTIIVTAVRLILGLGPIDEQPFNVPARFYPELGCWATEDKTPDGSSSLGLVPLHTLGWIQ
jgi:hypothetical protein